MNRYRSNADFGLRRKALFGGFLLMACAAFFLSTEKGETRTEQQPVVQTPAAVVISGRITSAGINVGGVTVNLSGTTNATAMTDASGNYQFSGLPEGGNFVVSPSLPNHFFTPPNRSFNSLSTNQIADYAARQICRTTNCSKNGKIAFVVGGGGAYNIFTMNADGSNQTNITNNQASTNYYQHPIFLRMAQR
jgi:hypothetical protein